MTETLNLGTALAGVDFGSITTGIMAVLPIGLPVSVGLTGLRKGLSFLMSMIKGA